MNSSVQRYTPLNPRTVLARVSQEELFRFYTGAEPRVGSLIVSPFRNDRNPTCSFFYSGDRLKLKDFGYGFSGDIFDTVMLMHNCGFYDALRVINRDFNLKLGRKSDANVQRVQRIVAKGNYTKKEQQIQVKIKSYTEKELKWWAQFGITREILHKFAVLSVSDLYLNKRFLGSSSESDPIYAYYFPSKRLKIYRPLNPRFKWLGNIQGEDIQGMHMADPSKDIIVTSSLKDVMTLYAAGYQAVAPHGEGNAFHQVLVDLLEQCPNKFILYDNDEPGRINSAKQAKKHGLTEMFIPEVKGCKDPSDYVSKHDLISLQNLIDNYGVRRNS